jgi:chromosome segregation ATPase
MFSFQCFPQINPFLDEDGLQRSDSMVEAQDPHGSINSTPVKKQYKDLLDEVETINKEVTTVRKQLWEAQDQIKEKEEKIVSLKNHIDELVGLRMKDEEMIKMLKEANTSLVEEEAKVRESMDLMKRVLTRSELKAKEDQETIVFLKEELKNSGNPNSSTINTSAMKRLEKASEAKERNLKNDLAQAEKQVEIWKYKHELANRMVNNLRAQMAVLDDPIGAGKLLEKQRQMIDVLEHQIMELELEEMEREEEDRDDLLQRHDIVSRACFDEDLDHSRIREVISQLDNSRLQEMVSQLDCNKGFTL